MVSEEYGATFTLYIPGKTLEELHRFERYLHEGLGCSEWKDCNVHSVEVTRLGIRRDDNQKDSKGMTKEKLLQLEKENGGKQCGT